MLLNHTWLHVPFFAYDRILSARLDDAGNWVKETGIRVDVGGPTGSVQVYGPHVVRCVGGFRMYFRAGSGNSSISSAHSTDGLSWRAEEGVRVAPGGDYALERVEGPYCLLWLGGEQRLYYSGWGPDGWNVYSRTSGDGLTWHGERLSSIGPEPPGEVKDPSVAVERDELVIWFRVVGCATSEIWVARSTDGVRWQGACKCRGLDVEKPRVGFPAVVSEPGGSWRMYYDEYAADTILGMQVATAVSCDGVDWRREGCIIAPGQRYDPDGVFGAKPVDLPDGQRLYYAGFWERHWLWPRTRLQHRRDRHVTT